MVDRDQNAVSMTYTLEDGYGSKIVVPGAGFLLNNEMGDFNAGPGLTDATGLVGTEPNLAQPGKRMLSSMTPAILTKDNRPRMLINLVHGEPIRFGVDGEKGVVVTADGAKIVDVAEVGEAALAVHDETRSDPSVAFALSRLADGPTSPTPIGVFRAVQRPDYGSLVNRQVLHASEQKGPGDLGALLASGATWTVG